jgi:hypothetical protein
MNAKQTLNAIYNVVHVEIKYNPEWENGAGYLDYAVINAGINVGLVAKSITAQGRKILMIGTRFGTVVFFERYIEKDNNIVVQNMPDKIKKLYSGLLLSSVQFGVSIEALMTLTGYVVHSDGTCYMSSKNIGELIEDLFN